MCIANTALNLLLESTVTFVIEGVPKKDGSMTISTAHDCSISWSQVFNIARQHIYMLHAGDLYTTRHWAAHKLMPRNTHATNGLLERHLWSLPPTAKMCWNELLPKYHLPKKLKTSVTLFITKKSLSNLQNFQIWHSSLDHMHSLKM